MAQEHKSKHYSGTQINEIKAVIRDRMKEGKSYAEIAEVLNATGIPTSRAGQWTKNLVSGFLHRYPLRLSAKGIKTDDPKRKATRSNSRPQAEGDALELATLVLSSNMAKQDQLRVLSALLRG